MLMIYLAYGRTDDVLSRTNQTVAECMPIVSLLSDSLNPSYVPGHNDTYGTNIDLSQFFCE